MGEKVLCDVVDDNNVGWEDVDDETDESMKAKLNSSELKFLRALECGCRVY